MHLQVHARVMRSTILIRVGGGWVDILEFAQKYAEKHSRKQPNKHGKVKVTGGAAGASAAQQVLDSAGLSGITVSSVASTVNSRSIRPSSSPPGGSGRSRSKSPSARSATASTRRSRSPTTRATASPSARAKAPSASAKSPSTRAKSPSTRAKSPSARAKSPAARTTRTPTKH